MRLLSGLSAMQAYLSASAYLQARPTAPAITAEAAEPVSIPPAPDSFPSVFFNVTDAVKAGDGYSPYRSALVSRFPQTTLPQALVDYLVSQAHLTGRHYSLFRHGPTHDPLRYEIRPGSPTEADADSFDDVLEEVFFDMAWVAHVHPPQKSPLPTDDDLNALSRRALVSGRRLTRHALFGFHHGDPVCVELQAIYDPIFRGVSMLHRTSAVIQEEADLRIQEWVEGK